ncbi:hypothetical protein CANARDRAFT_9327 [[Candida] arabinofermentans NRRL YB-2248]|uniref:Aldehyde dehydrogenase n=1 Tax=[Candida] arabinofermentans NRRL YB-2248 TaxID=983967 RepID=A0A1E4SWA7_9ASCO|nr:hypothetical protein CANARDRAFT_9327 [[Candida] arabinofermentans NRRL YB-2248]
MATIDNLNPSVDEIATVATTLSNNFSTSPKKSINFVKSQLSSIRKSLVSRKDDLTSALKKDFNRSVQETLVAEYGTVYAELTYMINNISSLLKPDTIDHAPLFLATTSVKVEKIPLGTILIITPFNYPLMLSLSPLIGALSCGNNVTLKLPYDSCPAFCLELTKLLLEAVDPSILKIVNGGIPESNALLDQKWDKILFTGSPTVGKIVMSKAAENLTPTLLELGGKSPAFITSKCGNFSKSIRRMLWGKFTNAGQTCIATDYLLVEDKIYDEVIKIVKDEMTKMFPEVDATSDFTHLINKRSYDRLTTSLHESKGSIVYGGHTDPATNFLSPTVIEGIDWDDSLMVGEIFGPILPIMKFSSLSNVVEEVKTHHDTPLAIYILTDDADEQKLISTIRSGSICINETLMQAAVYGAPFGGVGNSGYGNYHGKYSIDAFTHKRTILEQPYWCEFLLAGRYPPYNSKKIKDMMALVNLPINIPILSWTSVGKSAALLVVGFGVGYGVCSGVQSA